MPTRSPYGQYSPWTAWQSVARGYGVPNQWEYGPMNDAGWQWDPRVLNPSAVTSTRTRLNLRLSGVRRPMIYEGWGRYRYRSPRGRGTRLAYRRRRSRSQFYPRRRGIISIRQL
jgi:hypothetical protein